MASCLRAGFLILLFCVKLFFLNSGIGAWERFQETMAPGDPSVLVVTQGPCREWIEQGLLAFKTCTSPCTALAGRWALLRLLNAISAVKPPLRKKPMQHVAELSSKLHFSGCSRPWPSGSKCTGGQLTVFFCGVSLASREDGIRIIVENKQLIFGLQI